MKKTFRNDVVLHESMQGIKTTIIFCWLTSEEIVSSFTKVDMNQSVDHFVLSTPVCSFSFLQTV